MELIYRSLENNGDWEKIKRLYKKAFPLRERKPLWMIKAVVKKQKADVWIAEEGNEFLGFAITMTANGLVMLDYLAMKDTARGKGYGSSFLQWLQKKYEGFRFFLEIESVYVEAKNMQQRINRKNFYQRNGMQEAGVLAKVFGVELESLSYDCRITFDEYKRLYTTCYGRLTGFFVRPVKRGSICI